MWFRIGELLPARVGDISFNEDGAKLEVAGKMGPHAVVRVPPAPVLGLTARPQKDNPEAPPWFSNGKKRISYQQMAKRLKPVAVRDGHKEEDMLSFVEAEFSRSQPPQ
ncbi:MAG: hypothetical protein JRM78_01100 [Nitrososphaerota archaeon]|nr:hypothetical protein [Nitrososphaerota archaeon]MDG7047820.1 hypothetical protein [Nitrososphaerota archaeon]